MPRHSGETFRYGQRLHRKREFLRLFRIGQRTRSRSFTLIGLPRDGCARLGLSAKRRLGKACRRNQAKRLLREIFRRNQEACRIGSGKNLDLVVLIQRTVEHETYVRLNNEYLESIRRLVRRLDKNLLAAALADSAARLPVLSHLFFLCGAGALAPRVLAWRTPRREATLFLPPALPWRLRSLSLDDPYKTRFGEEKDPLLEGRALLVTGVAFVVLIGWNVVLSTLYPNSGKRPARVTPTPQASTNSGPAQ